MREIKFRAWHIQTKKMFDVFSWCKDCVFEDSNDGVGTSPYLPAETKDCILMQYTGLKDKDGLEIYEGDIVKWGHLKGSEENPIRIAIVKIEPDIKFEIINYKTDFAGQNKTFYYGSFAYKTTNYCLEVIGNIYQSPELL